MEANNIKGMKNEGTNTFIASKVNENKVPSILVNSVTKWEHERNKKQVKFYKKQQTGHLIENKEKADAKNAIITNTRVQTKKASQFKRTSSWSAGVSEKAMGKQVKDSDLLRNNASKNSKSKVTAAIIKPQKSRRNSLQTNPTAGNEKTTLLARSKNNKSRTKSPAVVEKKRNEKSKEKNNSDEDISTKQLDIDSNLLSANLQRFDETFEPQVLSRRKSMESINETVTQNIKVIAHFMPRRRFSQGAVSALKEVLNDMENDGRNVADVPPEEDIDTDDFAELSREEQLKILEQKSWVKNIDFNPSSTDLNSLTGGKKAKWKFQDSFYGNFNVGRRPSQDTAWGRRYK